ncbi:acyl carrier protein [Microvirga sp. W0021]|uniref:Acyl carrier protein n=1 Tax=Hohaiivirga grylli TaxID=3133970 RepID=A0ABV0BKY9_9HYPH
MSKQLEELEQFVDEFGTAPTLPEVPRRTLADKGIAGPTAAHIIEELHTPFNLAYLTFTTGSTAFQNIVGVTHAEIESRVKAALKAFELAGLPKGARALITYAPLVNVFPVHSLREHEMEWDFLKRSSRDAFVVSLCKDKPKLVVGESSFIRAALTDAKNLGFESEIPRDVIVFAAGTPLDLDLIETAQPYGWQIHDIYGCQEFGWLTLDGVPLRNDITFAPSPAGEQFKELVVGGLPLADSFPVGTSGHVCNQEGKIITYRRERTNPEYEVYIKATTLASAVSIDRVARTILRIKSRVVKVDPNVQVNAPHTILELVPSITKRDEVPPVVMTIEGPEKTEFFDLMVKAQLDLQQTAKTDPTWVKQR